MQDINDKINNMHMGKLIHMLSHEMKRNQPIDKVIKADLTIMQKHILKFILLEPSYSQVPLIQAVFLSKSNFPAYPFHIQFYYYKMYNTQALLI